MKRSLIKQANQAYTLTLPIEWVRKYGLKAGSEIDVLINEKSLIVSTKADVEGKKAVVNIADWQGRTIRNYILALYAKGIDEITVNSKEDISSEITQALNNIIGFALISQDKNTYILKDLNAGSYTHMDEIFKRVFQMVILFFESAIADIFGKEKEDLNSLKSRDVEVNKFCLFLQRAINKSAYPQMIDGRIVFTYSYALEKIGDEVERLWRTNIKYRPQKPKELRYLAELSKDGLGKAFDIYFRFSPKLMEDLYTIRENVRENAQKISHKNPHTLRLIRHIVKIVEDAADLNHLAIMKA